MKIEEAQKYVDQINHIAEADDDTFLVVYFSREEDKYQGWHHQMDGGDALLVIKQLVKRFGLSAVAIANMTSEPRRAHKTPHRSTVSQESPCQRERAPHPRAFLRRAHTGHTHAQVRTWRVPYGVATERERSGIAFHGRKPHFFSQNHEIAPYSSTTPARAQ